jgi:CDP-glucose 4,6-dehydratase
VSIKSLSAFPWGVTEYSISMNFTHLKEISASSPVLVTGHNGFKGTWLVQILDFLGIANVGLSLEVEDDSLYSRCKLPGTRQEFDCDINNFNQVKEIISSVKPSVVFHLAAQPIVSIANNDPYSTIQTNVMGTLNLLESVRIVGGVKAVGIVTTDKVYRNFDLKSKKFKECDELGATEPYGASKAAVEMLVQGYRKILEETVQTKLVALRSGNVIGGGDFSKDRLMPDMVRARLNSEKLHIRNPESTRPWQHVLDPLFGYLAAIEYCLKSGTTTHNEFNFGPENENEMTVQDVLEKALEIFPIDYEYSSISNSPSFHEAKYLQLDSELAGRVLGWNCRISSQQAVIDTLKWWNDFLDHQDARALCRSQIEQYLSLP